MKGGVSFVRLTYKWGAHAPSGLSADVAGKVLSRIEARDGSLTPKGVVDEARPESSPLHCAFDWNNKTAGEKWRREQARHMIKALVIVREDAGEEKEIRALVSVQDDGDDGPKYVSIDAAMSDKTRREYVIKEALAGLESWEKRYGDLAEFSGVSREIRAVVSRNAR
jgi:hypothetical protein